MNDFLQGEKLVNQLAEDHQRSLRFFKHVHSAIAPAYSEWRDTHSWEEIETPPSAEVPAPWRALAEPDGRDIPFYQHHVVDNRKYWKLCKERGLSIVDFNKLLDQGLDVTLEAAQNANLYGLTASDLLFAEEHEIHYAPTSLFASQPLLLEDGATGGNYLGEMSLTNIGEGDEEGYQALQVARLRCAKLLSTLFRGPLDTLAANNPTEVAGLSRTLAANPGNATGAAINKLLHTSLEGMMSVGQSVNFLIQPGVDNSAGRSVLELSKAALVAELPLKVSRIFISSDLGPEQMAGLAIDRLTTMTPTGMTLYPSVVDAYKVRQRNERQRVLTLEGDELEHMQRAVVRSIYRSEGCPAGAAVRLMSRMLLDALEA